MFESNTFVVGPKYVDLKLIFLPIAAAEQWKIKTDIASLC